MFLLVACFCFHSFFMLTFKKTTFLKEKYQRRYIFRKKQQKGIYFIGFSLVSLFRPVDVTNKGLLWNLFFIENFLFKVGLSSCGDLFFLYIYFFSFWTALPSPQAGFEPATWRLTAVRSTTELLENLHSSHFISLVNSSSCFFESKPSYAFK